MSETERTIERTLQVAAPRAQVFKALMDPGALSRWLFAAVTMKPEAGSAFSFEWRDSAVPATAQGEILELVPDSRLVLSWFMEADGVTSTASFDLSDAEGGTRLRFRHAGLPPGPEWDPRVRAVALEWDKVLLNLRFLLEERGEGKHLFYFRVETPLRAPAGRVFNAWTTESGLAAWLARDLYVSPEEGQDLEGVTLDTGKALAARFHRIAPERHLRMTWSEGGLRGLLGVSFWPAEEGVVLSLTLRSFALREGERPIIQALWEKRFQRLSAFLQRRPREDASDGTGRLALSRNFEATPSRAWNALTDAGLLRRWLVSWTDFEPRPGAPYTMLWDGYGEILGTVKSARQGESIVFTWDLPEGPTEVSVRIRPEPEQPGVCRLELEHAGFGQGPQWDRRRRAQEDFWENTLGLLDFYFRHGAGRERHGFHIRRRLALAPDQAASRVSLDAGRVVVRRATGALVELAAPEPALLSWEIEPQTGGSRVDVAFASYAAPPERVEEQRLKWAARLDALAQGRVADRG